MADDLARLLDESPLFCGKFGGSDSEAMIGNQDMLKIKARVHGEGSIIGDYSDVFQAPLDVCFAMDSR